ncbi:hypothetical protein MRB53_029229 [Persea americana]|uniref:Uncharacterized protein n=1 Tax=Persea americana TaxID=3435 RepID=A0ACC2KHT6_PERAE|nr:hypothetical protein MRB53_029229 [Persea americana]
MSSKICQGLQSCLEPRLVQQALCLRLVSPKPHIFKRAEPYTSSGSDLYTNPPTPTRKCDTNEAGQRDSSAFSSINSLADTPQEAVKYIHPLLRRSCSSMSAKSLELCTESLGCETGTGITENNWFSSSNSFKESEIESLSEIRRGGSNQASVKKKNKCKEAFPPPLTSIAGGSCIHVKPHREDGRLVIKTITAPSSRSYFQAERREGRLLLRFQNKSTPCSTMEQPKEEEEDEHERDDEVRESGNVEDINGDESNGGGEMGIGKIQRPGRCSEGGNGNRGMVVLGSLWVASS